MSETPLETDPPQRAAPVFGQVGQTRHVWKSILWAILTIGIYTYVWVFRTQKEMQEYTGRGVGGWLGFIIYFVFAPITWFLVPAEVKDMYERDGRESPVGAWHGLWFLLPIIGAFIWFIPVQNTLNDFWMSKGAPPPP